MRDLRRGNPPARTGNLFRLDVDVLFETHQLPIVRIARERETGFLGERNHGLVGTQRVAEQALGTESGSAAFQVLEQRGADAMALPAVVDRKTEFETSGIGVERVAGFADDGLKAVDAHSGDNAEALVFADMDEMIELRFRQL